MCSGLASSCLNRSSNTFHPAFVLAKSSGLTTTCLLGRQIQPEQDWLPMSIPQTYLMITSFSVDGNDAVFIGTSPLCVLSSSLDSNNRCCLSPGSASEKPDRPGRVSAHRGWAIWPLWLLTGATD